MKILFIDHYDSFSYLLLDCIQKSMQGFNLEAPPTVDIIPCDNKKILTDSYDYDLLVLSPGPMNPSASGYSLDFLKKNKRPVLGVCLGMQIINEFLGGKTVRSKQPLHGHRVRLRYEEHPLFFDIPKDIRVMRYNSLRCVCHPKTTHVIASQFRKPLEVMAIICNHKKHLGVQFHPESFQTEFGENLLRNAIRFLLEKDIGKNG